MGDKLNKSFSAKLQKSHKGGWTYVVWPSSVKVFGTRGLVKVRGTRRHMLPVKVETRQAIGKEVGEIVKVLLEERIRR
jgi:hypothetical protein